MKLRKTKVETVAPVAVEKPKAKPVPLTAEAFCKEHGIGGCCAEAIKRTWHLR